MNDLTLSGLITQPFQEYGQDGILFPVVVTSGGGAQQQSDEFTCLAYGNTANFLRNKAKAGLRVIFQGRLGSEKMGEKYQSAITVNRVLGVTESENGLDTSHIVVSGNSELKEIKYVGTKNTPLVPIFMTNLRWFKDKDGNYQSYKSFINASVWSDRATALSATVGEGERPLVISGNLRVRSYEDKDGDEITKIEVFPFEVLGGEELTPVGGDVSVAGEATTTTTPQTRPAQQKRKTKNVDDDPF